MRPIVLSIPEAEALLRMVAPGAGFCGVTLNEIYV